MHGQEIQIKLGKPPHSRLDRGTDVKELHVEENALALFGF